MQPMFLFILDKEKEQEDSINHSESSAFQKKSCVSHPSTSIILNSKGKKQLSTYMIFVI